MVKPSEKCLKRAWGQYLHPTGTLQDNQPKPQNLTIFTTEPARQNFGCAIWVRILTLSPFFENFWVCWRKKSIFHTLIVFVREKLDDLCWVKVSLQIRPKSDLDNFVAKRPENGHFGGLSNLTICNSKILWGLESYNSSFESHESLQCGSSFTLCHDLVTIGILYTK